MIDSNNNGHLSQTITPGVAREAFLKFYLVGLRSVQTISRLTQDNRAVESETLNRSLFGSRRDDRARVHTDLAQDNGTEEREPVDPRDR